MEILDSIEIPHLSGSGSIELLVGDLAAIPDHLAVEALVVSAFPDNYAPTPGTLIAALAGQGLSVRDLARDKEQDLRASSRCWLSGPITQPDLNFRRILCFEPLYQGLVPPATVVGDLFRCLVPLSTAEPWIRSIATPLVATGRQRESPAAMMRSLVDAAVHWMSNGLALDVLRIVLYSGSSRRHIAEMQGVFRQAAESAAPILRAQPTGVVRAYDHDVFISYARDDEGAVDELERRISQSDQSVRVYRDTKQLDSGSAWQQELFNALDSSRFVLPIYSPSYLGSPVCLEELHIAWMRHREEGGNVLVPAFLRSTGLPTYMRLIQYTDVRESDPTRIAHLADSIVQRVDDARQDMGKQRIAPATIRRSSRTEPPVVSAEAVSSLLTQLTSGGEINLDVSIRLRDR